MESDHVVVPVSTEFPQNYFDFSHTDGDSLRDYLKMFQVKISLNSSPTAPEFCEWVWN